MITVNFLPQLSQQSCVKKVQKYEVPIVAKIGARGTSFYLICNSWGSLPNSWGSLPNSWGSLCNSWGSLPNSWGSLCNSSGSLCNSW